MPSIPVGTSQLNATVEYQVPTSISSVSVLGPSGVYYRITGEGIEQAAAGDAIPYDNKGGQIQSRNNTQIDAEAFSA